jgi:hypothetical protein
VTNFTLTLPEWQGVYYNVVGVRDRAGQGGTLCTNGAWRARRQLIRHHAVPVFIKDGVTRRSRRERHVLRLRRRAAEQTSTLKSSSILGQWMP